MMADFAKKRATKEPKPQWIHDHDRVIAGEPFTTRDWDDKMLARHKGVTIPQPVNAREFFPDQADIHPAGMFELRGVLVGGVWEPYWFDIRYAERANMAEFKRKPDAGLDARDQATVRARFMAPTTRKDLA